jgi:endoglucanase
MPHLSAMDKLCAAALLAFADSTFVEDHGRLSLGGSHKTQIVDQNGNAVQLRGISTFSPPYFANCIQQDAFQHMVGMGATMVRIAMDADTQYWDAVDQASAAGLYVLIDYHYIGAKPIADDNARNFFRTAATRFHSYNNVIYELFNEPADMAWSELKQYHEAMLAVIRPIDPLALVVAGTPAWSGKTDAVVGNMINDDKVLYTKHFYASSHHDQDAIGNLLTQVPVFVTEWGICSYTGDGALDYGSAQAWQNMMNGGNPAGVWVSWANWGWDDKGESCSYLNPGSCDSRNWGSHSASGSHVDGYLKAAGPPSPSPSPLPGSCSTNPGQNNNGVNLEDTPRSASNPGECCSMCMSSGGCKGYTHVTGNGECWLKSQLGSLTADSNVNSGSYDPPVVTTIEV